MEPKWERIAFVGATTFAVFAGLVSLGTASDDTTVVSYKQPDAVATAQTPELGVSRPTPLVIPKPLTSSTPAMESAPTAVPDVVEPTAPVEAPAATAAPVVAESTPEAPTTVPPPAADEPVPAAPTSTPEMDSAPTAVPDVAEPTAVPDVAEPTTVPDVVEPTAVPDMVEPTAPIVAPAPTEVPQEAAACHPAYVECLPVVDDLDCADVAGPIYLHDAGYDPYRLDGDADGIGCER